MLSISDPIDNSGLSLVYFVKAYHAERHLLLNPYFDNPSEHCRQCIQTRYFDSTKPKLSTGTKININLIAYKLLILSVL